MHDKKSLETIALATAMKCGIRNKNVSHFVAFEKEEGPFPQNINRFCRDWLALQGVDLEDIQSKKDIEVVHYLWNFPEDRILVILICF